MNSKIVEILKAFGINENDLPKLKNIEWKAQTASKSDILFYYLKDRSQNSIDLMKKRISDSSYGILIYNSETDLNIKDGYALSDADLKSLKSKLLNELYPLPSKKFIGVTGTNGKTTTVDIISQLLNQLNLNCLTIGTLGARINGDEVANFSLTSPDYIDLRKTIFNLRDQFDVCALEASSHALDQGRLGELSFDSIGWTSFSQDHLDYHKNMEEYYEAKRSLLNYAKTKFVISSKSMELQKKLGKDALSFKSSTIPKSPFFMSEFNQVNLEVALGCVTECGLNIDGLDLEILSPPPGRFNTIINGSNVYIIDFAHTPDALENVCKETKRAFKDKKLICVFGCGGNRDSSKRSLMGAAASSICDYVVLTSDNPRFEDPKAIIEDIALGVSGSVKKICDRKEAIEFAVRNFDDSVVIIAGKGHEPYIDIKGVKKLFSDEKTLRKIIGRK